jgi:hypothetical protein
MAITIGIMGDTGSGKTTSIRTVDPETTYYINADGKPPMLPGFFKMFNTERRNYKKTSDAKVIANILKGISEEASHIQTVIIDTMNAIMLDDEMQRMKTKGYDKWMDLAASIYNLINLSNKDLRENLIVIMMFHEETFLDDDGVRTTRILTNGRKLEKIKLESKLPIVLRSMSTGEDGNNEYWFETKKSKSNTKTPIGLFEEFRIPNDLNMVIQAVRQFMGEYEK